VRCRHQALAETGHYGPALIILCICATENKGKKKKKERSLLNANDASFSFLKNKAI